MHASLIGPVLNTCPAGNSTVDTVAEAAAEAEAGGSMAEAEAHAATR